MFKTIRTDRFNITEEQLVLDELCDLLESTVRMATTYSQNFKRTAIQQHVWDVIESSELPPGEVIHILLYGSTGSGKSTAAFDVATETMLAFPGTYVLGARRTYVEIEDSIYTTFADHLDKYGVDYTTSKGKYTHYLNNGSRIRFRSAEKTATRKKSDKADELGSTEYSLAIMEECDEIPEEFARTVSGRMRQATGVERKIIFYICNPPSKDHWIYRFFFEDPENPPDDPASRKRAIHMPVEANREHVGEAYIRTLYADYADNPAYFQRLVKGHFGPTVKGFPIYGAHFRPAIHVADKAIRKNWNRDYPLQRSWDFGFRRPACIVFQDDIDTGQLRIFREFLGDRILLDPFADRALAQLHAEFPGARWEDFCDPAGDSADNQGRTKKTAVDILRGKGLHVKFQRTSVEYGINIIAEQLALLLPSRWGPQPAIIIDPSCTITIEAFEFGYCNEKEVLNDAIRPAKDGYYEHLLDALRYGVIFKRRPSEGFKGKGQPSERYGRYRSLGNVDEVLEGGWREQRPVTDFINNPRGSQTPTAHSYGFSKRRKW